MLGWITLLVVGVNDACSPQERRSPLRESKYQTGWWNAGNVSFHPIEKPQTLMSMLYSSCDIAGKISCVHLRIF